MRGCAGVATQSISFTCVGSTHPQDSAYRAFMFPFPLSSVSGFSVRLAHLSCLIGALNCLKGGISNSVMQKRDPWASLCMNNPCVFRGVGDKGRLCLNACPIKHSGGEIKGCLHKCSDVRMMERGFRELILPCMCGWFMFLDTFCIFIICCIQAELYTRLEMGQQTGIPLWQ